MSSTLYYREKDFLKRLREGSIRIHTEQLWWSPDLDPWCQWFYPQTNLPSELYPLSAEDAGHTNSRPLPVLGIPAGRATQGYAYYPLKAIRHKYWVVLTRRPDEFNPSTKCLSGAFRAEIPRLSEYLKGGFTTKEGTAGQDAYQVLQKQQLKWTNCRGCFYYVNSQSCTLISVIRK